MRDLVPTRLCRRLGPPSPTPPSLPAACKSHSQEAQDYLDELKLAEWPGTAWTSPRSEIFNGDVEWKVIPGSGRHRGGDPDEGLGAGGVQGQPGLAVARGPGRPGHLPLGLSRRHPRQDGLNVSGRRQGGAPRSWEGSCGGSPRPSSGLPSPRAPSHPPRGAPQSSDLEEVMMDALVSNKPEFVRLFVDNGAGVADFLAVRAAAAALPLRGPQKPALRPAAAQARGGPADAGRAGCPAGPGAARGHARLLLHGVSRVLKGFLRAPAVGSTRR